MEVPSNDGSDQKNSPTPSPRCRRRNQTVRARMHAGIGRARARQPHARDGGNNDDREVHGAGATPASTTDECPKICERRGCIGLVRAK